LPVDNLLGEPSRRRVDIDVKEKESHSGKDRDRPDNERRANVKDFPLRVTAQP
jgi:hypothetical protein